MASSWGEWKSFPNPDLGEYVEAPIGPGVYEVRRILTGELVAFDHAANVAQALASLLPNAAVSPWSYWLERLGQAAPRYPASDLEYRTCPAKTANEARTIADRMNGRREVYMKRRAAMSLA
jgi:hypothetical protein